MFNIHGTDSNVTLRKYTTEQNSTEFYPCPFKKVSVSSYATHKRSRDRK